MKNRKRKLIIFDYDGVLVDSVSINSKAFIRAFAGLEIKVNPEDFIVGNSLKEQFQYVVEKYQIRASYKRFKDEFENIVAGEEKNVKLRKEFTKLIKDLSQKYFLAIASNNSRDRIIKTLSTHKIQGCFDKIAGIKEKEKFQGASKEERLKEILNNLGFSAKQATLIDDIPKHIRIAHNMGIKTIAFVYEENKHMDFPRYACLSDSASGVKKCILGFQH